MSHPLIDLVRAEFPTAMIGSYVQGGDPAVLVGRDRLVDLMTFLRDDERTQMNMLVMVTGVDYLEFPAHLRPASSPADPDNSYDLNSDNMPRYEVVYELLSMAHKHRLRVKVPLHADDPTVPTMCGVWAAANWGEREVWDMLGVVFEGHPDPRRILMYEEFVGHPLRKDYDQRGYQPLIDMPHLAEYADHARDR